MLMGLIFELQLRSKNSFHSSACAAGYNQNHSCQRVNRCDDDSGDRCRTHLSQQYVAVVRVADFRCL